MSRRGGTAAVTIALGVAASPACDGTFTFDEHSIDAGFDAGADPSDAAADRAPPDGGACTRDDQCGGTRCDVVSGACVACLANDDCKDGARRFCSRPLEYCVECLTDDTCGPRKRCEATAHRCIDTCAEHDESCPSGFSCDEDRERCVECRGNANCASNPGGPVCDTAIGRCVECASSAQCPIARPACDRRSGRCVECITSLGCGASRVCDPSALVCRDK